MRTFHRPIAAIEMGLKVASHGRVFIPRLLSLRGTEPKIAEAERAESRSHECAIVGYRRTAPGVDGLDMDCAMLVPFLKGTPLETHIAILKFGFRSLELVRELFCGYKHGDGLRVELWRDCDYQSCIK